MLCFGTNMFALATSSFAICATLSLFGNGQKRTMRETMRLAGKDVLFAAIGLIVSIALAAGVNPEIVLELFEYTLRQTDGSRCVPSLNAVLDRKLHSGEVY